jgi:hypothetical protein
MRLPPIPARARARLAAAIAVTIFVLPAAASGQGTVADSLAGVLTTTDVHQRALAVARLNALPLAELTPNARAALVELLDAEATKRVPLDAEQPTDEDETYDEYVIDLTDAVLKLDDPAALRGLTILGIQTGRDVQRWVAARGASSLPALDAAWAADPQSRGGVITTWALMLRNTGSAALGAADRARLLGAIVGATDDLPIEVAAAARAGSLVALVPALDELSRQADDEVVRNRAAKAVEILAPARDALTPAQALGEAQQLARGFCARPGLANDPTSHPNRPSVCGVIGADFNKARAALRTGRPADARAALTDAASTAAAARAAGSLAPAEAASVEGNVQYLLGRI